MASTINVTVGIDLGTTNYSAVICNEKIQPLVNEEQLFRTPCFVFFCSQYYLHVGVRAKKLENINKKNGFYDAKRFLGREYNDAEVRLQMSRMRYTVKEDLNEPVFVIELPNNKVYITPTEISSLILAKIKEDIELKLEKKCNIKAVIAVPAKFSKHQQRAILEAAKLADLQVLKLLDEPVAITAQHIAFYKNMEAAKEDNLFLVYNLGGSSFNLAIVKVSADATLNTIAVSDDTNLSGQEFDQVLFNYFWVILINIYKFADYPTTDFTPLRHYLLRKSEEIKIELSKETASCLPKYACKSLPFVSIKIDITRDKFEELAKDLLLQTVDLVDRFLQKNNLNKSLLKAVLLCGGLINMPKIQDVLMQCFNDVLGNVFMVGDTCCAEGAALYAGLMSRG